MRQARFGSFIPSMLPRFIHQRTSFRSTESISATCSMG